MLLSVDDYLPGAVLPPHLSPFVEVNEGDYVPPEKQRLNKLKLGIVEEPATPAETNTKTSGAQVESQNGKKEETKAKAGGKGGLEKLATVELKKAATKASQKSDTSNGKNKQAVVESEDEQEEEQEGSDEEVENDMKVDIDSPGEQSETEEEVFSSDDEKQNKKNRTTVKSL
jgi:pescadillo protein